jgi:hypothetical protein
MIPLDWFSALRWVYLPHGGYRGAFYCPSMGVRMTMKPG